MTTLTRDRQVKIDEMDVWRPDWLLKALLIWTSFVTAVLVWLPLMRGLIEGPAYRWAFAGGVSGKGTGGAYWVLVIGLLFSGSLLYFGWRGARQPFHWLLLLFHGALAAAVLSAAINSPEQLFFEGATWGIRFSFARTGPLFFSMVFLCALFWAIRDLRSHRRRSAPPWVWTRGNRVRIWLVVAIVPAQIILLRMSGPFGTAAMLGVALTIWQWLMITARLLDPVGGSADHRSMAGAH